MSMRSDRYDAVIIGSGFGGAAAAFKLSKAGIKTALIERGGWAKRDETDWDSREILVNKRYKSTSPVLVKQFGETKHKTTFLNEMVGGNSVFYGGASLRMREKDFEKWPLSYSDFEPYYTEAENLLEISGRANVDPFEPPRSQDYPFQPAEFSAPALRIKNAAEQLLMKPFNIPLALNFNNKERTLCTLCNTCDGHPCKISAKNDLAVVLLSKAQEAGVEILAGTIVKKLIEKDGRIASVICVNRRTKEEFLINSGLFILSAGAINSSAILLRSDLDKYPNNKFVGRYFMRHCSGIVTGIFPKKTNPENVFHKQICIADQYEDQRKDTGYAVGVIQDIYSPNFEVVKHFAPLFLRPFSKLGSMIVQNLLCISEDEPLYENRIYISTETDEFGISLVDIQHNFTSADYKRLFHLKKNAEKVLKKAGAFKSMFNEIDRFSPPSFSHAIGTARFGNNPDESVLDIDCKYHGIDNLYVIDGSFMPTSSGVNPSLTIFANALRASDRVLLNYKG